ncbi:MAG TPA: hypothetical protein VFH15_05650 [Pyrinomonadaceae bacterium]|nr:hypothetical protein [Pyrinomonadaceae bacterium]
MIRVSAIHHSSTPRSSVELYGDDYPAADGTCVRDNIDLARAHILALESPRNAIYNLGCGEIIDCAKKITGRSIPVRIAKRRAGDPATLIASSQAIKRDLAWSPEFQKLELIIESVWTWLKDPSGYS